MTDFTQFYAKEAKKHELRETIEAIAADALAQIPPDFLASYLILAARELERGKFVKRGRNSGAWGDEGKESLRRLADGELSTRDDLLREIANRNLNAGTRRAR